MTSLGKLTIVALAALFAGAAGAQEAPPPATTTTEGLPTAPQPYVPSSPPPAPAATGYRPSLLGGADSNALSQGLAAAKAGDLARAESYRAQISDPTAQNIIRWAEADALGPQLSFLQLDAARRDFAGWPRANTRQAAAERAMENAGMDPDRTIAWFNGAPPLTAEGAMSLAAALQAKGREDEARALIKAWWRDHLFDADVQARMQARYGAWLTHEDHNARLDTLLLGPQGRAVQALMPLLDADHQALAEAVMAQRNDAGDALNRFVNAPASVAKSPVLAEERARFLRRHGLDQIGLTLVGNFPAGPIDDESAERIWLERRNYFNLAIRAHDWRSAYAAMANSRFPGGERLVDAEFFAGWVALTKLKDPALADKHFETLQKVSSTPITQGRALYWRGRAAEARGDEAAAAAFYQQGSKYFTSFYGQLAAAKAGVKTITLPRDPVPTEADRQRFEGRSQVKAARMLAEAGERDRFKAFVLALNETLPSAEEVALLVDLARSYSDQDLAMRVIRGAAQRGFILAERGYPVVRVPVVPGSAEPAYALSIARQESNFLPTARSGANARGVMQLIPSTARTVARQLGVPWNEASLYEPEYNMRLGAYHLGQLQNMYGGSMVMTSAGYNAGPTRPPQWANECGDPRGGTTDPLDFIECIPFTETRNYVMRTLETTQIYRARLAGGTAPLSLAEDIRRGAYGYSAPVTTSSNVAEITLTSYTPVGPPPGTHPYYGPPTRLAHSKRPHGASTHSASRSKTHAKTSRSKAAYGKSSATRHPSSKTSTRSAKRPARHRS